MIRTIRARALFLAAILILTLSVSAAAQEQELEVVTLLPHTSEAFGLESVVPEGWADLGAGLFARQRDAEDQAVIALQSAPASQEEVLTSLLPQLALTEAPESVGEYQGAALNWTLYKIDVPVAGVIVDLGLVHQNQEGVTYLALLQAAPEEYPALHDTIFLPMLDAFAPYEEELGPVPYAVEEITFENSDITLAGTLTLPPGSGPHPAIVLVSGSGPQDRDETLGGGITIRPFRLLADALTRAGVAVLRYDDRGVGASTGSFSEATIDDFAADAEAAIHYLLGRAEIDPDQIGLLGHSEGGLVAAMLGARNDDLAFIINLAGPGVNGRDVLLLQSRRLMEAEGATEEQAADNVAFAEALIPILDDPEAVEALVYDQVLEQFEALPAEQREALGNSEEYARTLARQVAQELTRGWLEGFLAYDPAVDWAQTTVPVLAIFGDKDVQVDAEQNAQPLEEALLAAGNDDIEIVILPNANHLFQAADTGGMSEYTTLPGEFTPDLLPIITDWLNAHLDIAQPVAATPGAATPVP
jgi:pimeloyl-ACP methyl ester carboxylesterase